MFGFKNFTGFSFVGKIGRVGFEFTAGIGEEVTFNITNIAAANAAEIPENSNLKLVSNFSKDQFITSTSVAAASKITGSMVAGATPNLFL